MTGFSLQKERITEILNKLRDEISIPNRDRLGTHSLRKCAATHARRQGCSRDDVNARGRWKHNKQIVDVYIDNSIPYPDAKVASVLCVGDPIGYKINRYNNF